MKKSLGLLQAYGEYQRFLQVSKQFLQEKGVYVPGTLRSKRRRRRPRTGVKQRNQRFEEEHSPGDDRKYEEIDKILNEKLSKETA